MLSLHCSALSDSNCCFWWVLRRACYKGQCTPEALEECTYGNQLHISYRIWNKEGSFSFKLHKQTKNDRSHPWEISGERFRYDKRSMGYWYSDLSSVTRSTTLIGEDTDLIALILLHYMELTNNDLNKYALYTYI